MMIQVAPTGAATKFADPTFESQWNAGTLVYGPDGTFKTNQYGPLSTAREGQMEAYKEAPNGQRLVQYFDKARMELGPEGVVTAGLLTVEMKTGQMQLGDATFEQRQPAQVNLAGDPGSAGPTYADLARMPEVRPYTGNGSPYPYLWDGTQLVLLQKQTDFPFTYFDYSTAQDARIASPDGRYAQWVPGRFVNFLDRQGPVDPATGKPNRLAFTGFPISPFFFAKTTIGGKATWVLIQAFERRVLTYNPSNPLNEQIEFGNIGQHYYTWRYSNSKAMLTPATSTNVTPNDQPDTNGRYHVGQRGVDGPFVLKLWEYRDPVKTALSPQSGNRVISFDVTVENSGAKTIGYNPFNAAVKAADDRVYSYGISLQSVSPELGSGDLATGGRVRGWVTFEVPMDAVIIFFRMTDFDGHQVVFQVK